MIDLSIGVLTQETDRNVTIFGNQLVAATYVKFIESAGGRMVPILYPLPGVYCLIGCPLLVEGLSLG